jgi:hypothetical protein
MKLNPVGEKKFRQIPAARKRESRRRYFVKVR